MKNLLLTITSLMLSASAFAGGETGGGGDAVKCNGKYLVYDVIDARGLNLPLKYPTGTYDAKVRKLIQRVEKVYPTVASKYLKTYEESFYKEYWLESLGKYKPSKNDPRQIDFYNGDLLDIPDTGVGRIPAECGKSRIEQAAVQVIPGSSIWQYPYRYQIANPIWKAMDDDQKAILTMHEIILFHSGIAGSSDTSSVRYVNARMIADALPNTDKLAYEMELEIRKSGTTWSIPLFEYSQKAELKGVQFDSSGKFAEAKFLKGEVSGPDLIPLVPSEVITWISSRTGKINADGFFQQGEYATFGFNIPHIEYHLRLASKNSLIEKDKMQSSGFAHTTGGNLGSATYTFERGKVNKLEIKNVYVEQKDILQDGDGYFGVANVRGSFRGNLEIDGSGEVRFESFGPSWSVYCNVEPGFVLKPNGQITELPCASSRVGNEICLRVRAKVEPFEVVKDANSQCYTEINHSNTWEFSARQKFKDFYGELSFGDRVTIDYKKESIKKDSVELVSFPQKSGYRTWPIDMVMDSTGNIQGTFDSRRRLCKFGRCITFEKNEVIKISIDTSDPTKTIVTLKKVKKD